MLLTISAKIKIPFYPVPMTMQTFVVLFLGIAFGYKIDKQLLEPSSIEKVNKYSVYKENAKPLSTPLVNDRDCTDLEGFADSSGDTCAGWYEPMGCGGAEGYANADGVSALDACCVCGGGDDPELTACDEAGGYYCGTEANGGCMPASWECDGWSDCADGADEAACGPPPTCEDLGLWDCGDGQCINPSYVCDGSNEHGNASWGPDCANGGDEIFDTCCEAGSYADSLCNPPAFCEDETACNNGAEGACQYAQIPFNCDGSLMDEYFVDCDGWIFSNSYLSWLGDGYCDAESLGVGYGIDFYCEEYGFDSGDCAGYEDCNGTFGGTSVLDECGVCDGSGIAEGACDCDGNTLDCAGVCGGASALDDCGVCDGGNANKDCAGVCDGDSFTDCAGTCLAAGYISWVGDGYCDDGYYGVDYTCPAFNCDNSDCGLVIGDEGICEIPCTFYDCAGNCADGYESYIGDGWCDGTDQAYGFDFSCLDCDGGDCAGDCGCEDDTSCLDDCGVPNGGNADMDCGGTCFGDAFTDCIGTCASSYYLTWIGDGYCDAEGSGIGYGLDFLCEEFNNDNGDCDDCAGTPLGDSALDICGVCDGDGWSCFAGTGDVNQDGSTDVIDLVAIVNHILGDSMSDGAVAAADATGDGVANILDVIIHIETILESQLAIDGCTDSSADNYNADATDDDGSCLYNGCAADEWNCGDGQCIPASYVCDGSVDTCNAGWGPDCDNGADESLATCGDAHDECPEDLAGACADAGGFYCGDDQSNWTSYSPNGCVPSSYICDGWDDCVDASDEADCAAADPAVCAATFTVAGSADLDLDGVNDDCYIDGTGYYLISWDGGCQAGMLSSGDESLDATPYNFTSGFYLSGFASGETLDFVLEFVEGGAGTAEGVTNLCPEPEVPEDLAGACAESGGHFCGDDESNWTSYSPNGCVVSSYICDGWDDCVDASDEAGCEGRAADSDESFEMRTQDKRAMAQKQPIAKQSFARKSVVSNKKPLVILKKALPEVSSVDSTPESAGRQSQATKLDVATGVTLVKSASGMTFNADGFVGFEITLEHGDNFDISLTDAGIIASSRTEGNTTKVVVVNNANNEIFRSSGNYDVVDVVVGTAGGQEIFANVVEVMDFGLSAAYPNPFNPTTSMNLSVAEAGNVSVQVYNLVGQIVSTVVDGHMEVGSHSISWNASDLASGVYLVKAVSQDNVSVQKVMLVK